MWQRISDEVLGRRPPDALPPSAREAIEADRRKSEILVCCAQFAAIAFFGAFYTVTPKAFPEGVPFEPVPWTLAAYTLFTSLRLWFALRDRLGPLFLGLSIVVDIGVLMLTIWSFHLQYQQEPAIYLKAPTLLYVFILVALRTLRFEAVYVILAGVAAILGWLILLIYAIAAGGKMEITRSFVEYMTSQKILVGAEIDKLVSIAAVTAVLSVAVIRARRLMVRAAVEAHMAAELSRFFAPEVAGEIRRASAEFRPGDAVLRQAAVMMLDLRSFTALAADLGPRGTVALLADFHRRIVPIVQSHGGSIDKYLGDGVMTTFGAVQPSDTFAADALRALLDLGAAFETWADERQAAGEAAVRAGAAVTVGKVLFGVTGDRTRLEFTVIGSPVNLAAKVEKHSRAVGRPLLATRAALDMAVAQGFTGEADFDPLPAQRVEGTEGRIDLVAAGAWRGA
jgi:adenylate cyclase